ncbi:MAG: Omp28-related outer membrane protein [Bacteroidia bacterium]
MKKIYLAAFVVMTALALSSCQKDEPIDDNGGDNVPSTFTQKVLVEEFSGAWCGWCVDGAYRLEEMMKANANILGVTIHQGDGMQISAYTDLDNTFNVTGFPSGMVGRRPSMEDQKVPMSRGYWSSNATPQLTETASCGLKIDASSAGSIKVTTGFNKEVTGDVRLTVYVIEDEVTGTGSGYDQSNYYSGNGSFPTHPYYSQPSKIVGFKHMLVLRKVLSGATLGDKIDGSALVAGGKFEKTFSLDLGTMNAEKVKIVAFVNVVGSTGATHKVLNAQQVKLGASKGWD